MVVDILKDRQDGCEKKTMLHVFTVPNDCSCVPVNQYDADNEEGDGSGEEIGSRYAVRHHLRLTDKPFATGAGVVICARCDDGIRVVAVEQQAV